MVAMEFSGNVTLIAGVAGRWRTMKSNRNVDDSMQMIGDGGHRPSMLSTDGTSVQFKLHGNLLASVKRMAFRWNEYLVHLPFALRGAQIPFKERPSEKRVWGV